LCYRQQASKYDGGECCTFVNHYEFSLSFIGFEITSQVIDRNRGLGALNR
jgi:hypothetical protein